MEHMGVLGLSLLRRRFHTLSPADTGCWRSSVRTVSLSSLPPVTRISLHSHWFSWRWRFSVNVHGIDLTVVENESYWLTLSGIQHFQQTLSTPIFSDQVWEVWTDVP